MRRGCYFIGVPVGAGSVPAHFWALGLELVRRGNIVKVICPPRDGRVRVADENPATFVWPSPRSTRLTDALFLARLTRRFRPDCMIANFGAVNWMCLIGWMYRVACRIAFYHTLSRQIEIDQRDRGVIGQFRRFRKKHVYHAATNVVGISRAALSDVQKNYSVPPAKCNLWRYSMADPAKRFKVSSGDERANLVVCAARFSPSKGQDVLIDALALLPEAARPEVEFIGSGETLNELQARAERSGVAGRCVFRGSVPHEEVLRSMARAKVVVVPSRDEAFGLVNIEAMSVGTPVIASKVGGIPEIVRDGVDGFLVPPGSPRALAEKLTALLPDRRLQWRLGQNARQRFLEEYEDSAAVSKQADWLEQQIRPNGCHPTYA